jgi:hypothetical protein
VRYVWIEACGNHTARSCRRRSKNAIRSVDTSMVEPNTPFWAGRGWILANTDLRILDSIEAIAHLDGALRSKAMASLFILRVAGESRHEIEGVTTLEPRCADNRIICISKAPSRRRPSRCSASG